MKLQIIINKTKTGFRLLCKPLYKEIRLPGIKGLLAILLLFAGSIVSIAQVTVSGSVGEDGTYSTLAEAFTELNTGAVQTSAIIEITISANTSEPAGGAILNAGAWTSLSIKPSGGAARTISAAVTAGLPLIDLNGADYVTIDGLNTGGNSLTISNSTVSTSAGTSTIRFINGATENTVTKCSIEGSSTATDGGTIYFSTDVSTANGNDNNTISSNNIGPAGSNFPIRGICSFGSGASSPDALHNGNILISGNNIFDYFSATLTSSGIFLNSGTTDWTIQNNKLYQTATRTQTTGTTHAGIRLSSSNINNCAISGNTIGFSSSAGTGIYDFVGSGTGSRFYPIYISAHGSLTASGINGNTITAISVTGPLSGSSASQPFSGIFIITSTGLVNIGTVTGNTIGSTSSSGAIVFSSSSSSASTITAITSTIANNNITVANNSVGGIQANNSSSGAVSFYGIFTSTATSITTTIQNNTIGYINAPITGNTISGTVFRGILNSTGNSNINGNIVAYLQNNSSSVLSVTTMGIQSASTNAAGTDNVSQNTVHSLANLNSSSVSALAGIYFQGPNTGNIVSRNTVHSLTVASASAGIYGIFHAAGFNTYRNNIIRLGYDNSGSSMTIGCQILGMPENGGVWTNNFYFNSVYIGGTGVTGTAESYALASFATNGTRNYKNNIFYNARSNSSGTGKHYAITVAGTSANPAGVSSDYNDILANGTGGISGLFNSIDRTSLSAWQAATGQDANSQNANPQFINPSGTLLTMDLHIQPSVSTPIEATGIDVGVSDDFDGQTRSSLTPSDMGADAGNFTSGTREINVKGNGTTPASIVDGDATPSTTDSTDFGNVTVSSSLVRRYTIENTGNLTLTISSIVSSGTNSSEFVVSGAPTIVEAGSSRTFIVTYTPTASGSRTATITINSNDADEAAYDFAVKGGLTAAPNTYTYTGTGNWTDEGNWSPSYPGLTVPEGYTVINNGDMTITTEVINNGTITNDGSLTINGGELINEGTFGGSGEFSGGVFINPPDGLISPGD